MAELFPFEIACDQCGGIDVEYVGEAYDDEHYIGSHWHCLECGHEFNEDETDYGDRVYFDLDDGDYDDVSKG